MQYYVHASQLFVCSTVCETQSASKSHAHTLYMLCTTLHVTLGINHLCMCILKDFTIHQLPEIYYAYIKST